MSSQTGSGTKRPQRKGVNSSFWTILGESSIVLTLITAVLFMIGWAYESNWYTYFGVSTAQVDIPLPQILIRSLPIIVTSLFITFIVYVLVSLYVKLREIFSWPEISAQSKLRLVSTFTPLFIYLYSLSQFPFSSPGNPFKMIRELPNEGIYASVVAVFLILAVLITGILNLVPGLLMLKPIVNLFISSLDTISQPVWVSVVGGINLITILFMSASIASSDAAFGKKGLAEVGIIQRVYLVSPKLLNFTNEFDLSTCYEKTCFYGPLGLVAENSNSFFLIQLNIQHTKFPRNPGIYEIPRSDQEGSFYVVPASKSILLPTATPSVTITTTITSSPTPIGTDTPQPTFTVTPSPIVATLTPTQH